MIVLHESAPGKLNLTLDILGKRPDGYHELEMVMISVSLQDDLTLELDTGAPWSVCCRQAALPNEAAPRRGSPSGADKPLCDIPDGPENLCWKAARVFFDAAGIEPNGLRIRVNKRIPAQAGMAGGSSDAAAVLRALNQHYACFDEEQLRALGLQVGSDVPYCLFGGSALARGRGEVLTRLPALPEQLCFLLAKPEFSVSTPALFREIDEAGISARPDTAAMLCALEAQDGAAIGALLQNAFEPLVAARYPVVEALRSAMLNSGALGARLTGTGSVVFGLYRDRAAAAQGAQALRALCPQVYLCTAL